MQPQYVREYPKESKESVPVEPRVRKIGKPSCRLAEANAAAPLRIAPTISLFHTAPIQNKSSFGKQEDAAVSQAVADALDTSALEVEAFGLLAQIEQVAISSRH